MILARHYCGAEGGAVGAQLCASPPRGGGVFRRRPFLITAKDYSADTNDVLRDAGKKHGTRIEAGSDATATEGVIIPATHS